MKIRFDTQEFVMELIMSLTALMVLKAGLCIR